ncbi:MAG: DMT family transporter [Gammaproteobacteria bacterium]|nr:DMT family transporter [Gammaproteobacteria bacterium]
MSGIHFTAKTKIALASAILLWASAFVGIRAGLESYSPGGLALLRFMIASICMLIIQTRLPMRTRVSWRDRGLLLLIGMFGLGVYNITLNQGEIQVASGIASFIISQSPVVTLVLAILFLGETLSSRMVIGMSISIFGVGLIALGETKSFGLNIGVFYILIATFAGGIYSVVQKPFLKKYHAIEVTAWIIWGATLFLMIWLPNMLTEIKTATFAATAWIVYLGIFPAALGYIAWSYGLKDIPASSAANALYFLPIVATFLGWIILGEVPVLLSLLGGFIALFGVWIVNRRSRSRI